MRSSDANPVLVFSELNYPDLLNAVNFMYNGSLTIAEDNLDGFMQAAKVLQIKSITPGYPTMPDSTKVNQDGSENNSSSSNSSCSETASDHSVPTSTLKPIPTARQSNEVTENRNPDRSEDNSRSSSSSRSQSESDHPVPMSTLQPIPTACHSNNAAKKPSTTKSTNSRQKTTSATPNSSVFRCVFCSKQFKARKNAMNHQLICARNPNRKIFQCKSCPRTFSRKYRWVAHEKTHESTAAEATNVPVAFKIGRK